MPTGKVKWYDAAKGFGFVSRDDGEGDVFVPKASLPAGVEELKAGTRLDFGVVDSRRGQQAMTVRVIDAPKSVVAAQAELKRRDPDQLHGMIEDMVKVLESAVQNDLRRGKYPDRKTAQKVAELMHAVARDLEI